MASIVDDIRYGFIRRYGAVGTLIVLNVGIYLVLALANVIGWMAGFGDLDTLVYRWLGLPAFLPRLATRPWTPVTYMFVHNLSGIFHLLFNMLWLFWIGGKILRDFLADNRIWGLFLFGGLTGGVLYLIAYNLLPVLRADLPGATLYGASAGVLAIVVGTATLVPNYQIGLLFFGLVRLKWLAVAMVVIDVISIPSGNAGGMIAHLGGALFGLGYISAYRGGTDLLAWTESIGELFAPKSRSAQHVRVATRQQSTRTLGDTPGRPSQAEVDRILDKIKSVGYDRLSQEEKQTLFNASKE